MDEAMAEQARIIAWLREQADSCVGLMQRFDRIADAIERGDHDTIAIPRLSGDQGVK